MTKIATLLFALSTIINTVNAQSILQKGTDIDGEAAFDYFGRSVSMPDKNTIAIGANQNDGNGTDAGHVRIYRWSGSAWIQKGTDIDGEAAGDVSGYSISMSDSNTVAIGAINNSGTGKDAGHVRIFRWNGSAWVQKGLDIDGEEELDQSGYSVSMPDSNIVAIGAVENSGPGINATGHVRIYRWNGSTWVQKGNDIDGEAIYDYSGYSVSMPDSNTVGIGAPFNGGLSDIGQVRIYRWDGTDWVQKGTDIDGEAVDDQSGRSISMPDSNTVAIGASNNDGNGPDAGHVRIYHWNGSKWLQKGIDIDGEAAGDQSGYSVSMPDSNTVAIGASTNLKGIYAGQVRIYHWIGGAWVKKGVDIDGEAAGDYSGFSVSMPDSNTVAIGAVSNDGTGPYAGHTRVYAFQDLSNVANLQNEYGNILSIYPNPTKGDVSIDLRTNNNDVTVVIRNQFGQNILKKSYHGSNLLQLNIPGKAGVYFIEVWSEDKKAIFKVNKE